MTLHFLFLLFYTCTVQSTTGGRSIGCDLLIMHVGPFCYSVLLFLHALITCVLVRLSNGLCPTLHISYIRAP